MIHTCNTKDSRCTKPDRFQIKFTNFNWLHLRKMKVFYRIDFQSISGHEKFDPQPNLNEILNVLVIILTL